MLGKPLAAIDFSVPMLHGAEIISPASRTFRLGFPSNRSRRDRPPSRLSTTHELYTTKTKHNQQTTTQNKKKHQTNPSPVARLHRSETAHSPHSGSRPR